MKSGTVDKFQIMAGFPKLKDRVVQSGLIKDHGMVSL